MSEFDYIIIGAGSAGCVLADKLSRDGQSRVLVVEAGGSDRSFWIQTPIGYGRTFFDRRINSMFGTEPDPQTASRTGYWPRGKVIGGSGSINAPVYCRGLPGDFADSEALGATGWGWDEVRAPWWGKLLQGMRYVLSRRGPLSLSVNQCGGFVRSRDDLDQPDLQLYLNPVTYTTSPDNKREIINPDPFAGFILSFQPSRPSSRGRIDIRSADPQAAPRIVPNYLSTQKDLDDVVAGGQLIQRMASTAAIRAFTKEAISPDIAQFDAEGILEDFRQRCGTVFHSVSTCRMAAAKRVPLSPPTSGFSGWRA